MNDKRSGLLFDKIPRIYYEKGALQPFVAALDQVLLDIEKKIEDLPSLVDIDTCPDYALPYLAALTKCPLWSQSPLLWRKQIKNWPYVCRMKGTQRALRYFFDSFGIVADQIETYWRDQNGAYTVDRPEGAPFFDAGSGLWHNSKTHYFGVLLSADEEDIVNLPDPDLRAVSKLIHQWIDIVKPYHAELLTLAWCVNIALPIPIHQRAECVQIVEARHCAYNLGSVRTTYWDGEFCLDGAIRLDGIYPDDLYREQLQQRAEITAFARSQQKVAVRQLGKSWSLVASRQTYKPRLYAVGTAFMEPRQSAAIKQRAEITQYAECGHKNDCRPTNLLDGSFCLDGSHQLDGMQHTQGLVGLRCTVTRITKNGEGVTEAV